MQEEGELATALGRSTLSECTGTAVTTLISEGAEEKRDEKTMPRLNAATMPKMNVSLVLELLWTGGSGGIPSCISTCSSELSSLVTIARLLQMCSLDHRRVSHASRATDHVGRDFRSQCTAICIENRSVLAIEVSSVNNNNNNSDSE
jgi:hypothetical protein